MNPDQMPIESIGAGKEHLEGAADPVDLFARAVAHAINENTSRTDAYHIAYKSVEDAFRYGVQREFFRRGLFETALNNPNLVVGRLFDGSGTVVESQTNKWIDSKIVEVLNENSGEFKEGVKKYVETNLDRLVIGALSRMILDTVGAVVAGNVDGTAHAVGIEIAKAFQNATLRMNRGY
jgi:hypothetical protein